MANLTFNLLNQASGIYTSTDTTNKTVKLYYLAESAPSNTDPVDFSTIWPSDESGYYFFLPEAATIADYPAFAAALKKAIGTPGATGLRWLAWIADPTLNNGVLNVTAFIPLLLSAGAPAKTNADVTFDFLNINLQIPKPSNLTTGGTTSDPVFELQAPVAGGNTITLNNGGINKSLNIPNDQKITIPLTGEHIGVMSYGTEWDRGDFYTFFIPKNGSIFEAGPSAEMRFQFNKSAPVNFRYPTFIGKLPDPQKPDLLFLNSAMDVLNPLDGNRTRFAFDLEKFTPTIALPVADSHRTSAGSTLYLNPKPAPDDTSDPLKVAGFGWGNRPNENDSNNHVLYLLPIGNYAVESQSPPPQVAGMVNVMCGLVGTEFLLAADSDLLEFSNQAKSLATGYTPMGTTNTDEVDDTYTTSWLRLIPGPNSDKVFTGNLKESYCVQSPNSIYYSPGSEEGFLMATGVRLASLADTAKTVPFPMVPYGSVYYGNAAGNVAVANKDVPATTLTSFEFDVLSPLRRQLIQPDLCNGPIFFSAASGDPLTGGFVRTPIGLLAELNDGTTPANTPAGTLKRLLLAKSPVNGAYMEFDAAPSPYCGTSVADKPTVVSPKLNTALMHNSVFLVASNADLGNIGPFKNEIQLGEFTYQVKLNGQPMAHADNKMTIMLFKFSTIQSVEDLAKDTNKWTDPADFVGDETAISDVSGRITKSIAEAKTIVDGGGDGAEYFQDFYTKMTDPKWTGMIVLNCELDYALLPKDIQVLLGGIDGELIAHHFGVTVNQIKQNQPSELDIDNSSLFSLIYYDKDYQTTSKKFEFQVTKLNVLYVNSVLAHFQSQIAMTVTELYGDKVSLVKGGPNDKLESDAILIDGVYLQDGESGHIVFDSTVPRFFSFSGSGYGRRVLNNVVINDATLIPISSVQDGSGMTTVKAAFRLNGEFGFTKDVSPDSSDVDLFSFPIQSLTDTSSVATLNFTCNDLDWDTTLNGNNATLGSIVTDLSNLKLDATDSDPRENSLVATFPLNLTGFNWSPGAGLNASAIGAKQVTGLGTLTGSGAAPQYSLVFSMSMGNLGGMTSGAALQGTVYLGWSAAGDTPSANNNISFLFVPPKEFASGDGGFKLQGVIDTVYGDLILNRFPLEEGEPEELFVLQLKDVMFTLFSIPLIFYPRVLTLFGDPKKPQGSNLSWFLSNPGGTHSPVSAIVTPVLGVMNGLKVNSELTGTQVISTAINNLNKLTDATDAEVIQSIYAQKEIGETQFNYDPKAGVLFFLDLEFTALTFKLLMADPSFYGGLIKIGDPGAGSNSFMKKWGGLEIEIDYRKISDGLGVYSVDFVLPESLRVIPSAESEVNFSLPSFGLEVFTNGDFKIEVGWPFSSTDSFAASGEQAKLSFVVEGIPLFFSIGLYFAKLRGADVPGEFPEDFKLIYMFGLGLAFGIDAKYPGSSKSEGGEGDEDEKGGVLSAEFQLYIWGQFQGMLVSKTGSFEKNGLDYQWWTTTIGVTINIQGKIDLVIISASIEVEATIYISFALETGHSTMVVVGADLKVEVSVKIIFVTIHIRFKHHFILKEWSFGSGPPALASGPTPCKTDEYKNEPGCVEADVEDVLELPSLQSKEAMPPLAAQSYIVDPKEMTKQPLKSMAMSEPQEAAAAKSNSGKARAKGSQAMEAADAASPTPITIYYLLQPTTNSTDGTNWNPQAVSSLLIPFDPANTGTGNASNTPFSAMLSALANNLLGQVTGADFSAQVAAINSLVHTADYNKQADSFLKTNFIFTIDKSSALTVETNVAVFPMFPQCEVTYNGNTTKFNGPDVPAAYIQDLQNYLNQYSNDSPDVSVIADPSSVDDMFFKDYFVMLAQQLAYELQLAINNGATTLTTALTKVNNSNIAGCVSQFMLHGLRLPTFSGGTVDLTKWEGMYQLAGLQTELVKSGQDYVTAFTLGLADATAADYIKFAGSDNPTTLVEDFPVAQVLDAAPSLDWLAAPGGISVLNPLVSSEKTFHLAQPNTYTKAATTTKLFPLPNAMQRELEDMGTMKVDLSLITDTSNGTAQASNSGTAVTGVPALYIPITINKVALPGATTGDAFYPNTYAIAGTDQYTRELLELFLNNFDSSATFELMIGTGNNNYVAPASTTNLILVKNNLSTDSEPETVLNAPTALADAPSALGPVQATLSDIEEFLRLIWEESVVRTAGYYLYLENIPAASFTGDTASIALCVSSGAAASSTITLESYHNQISIGQTLGKGALAAGVLDSAGDPVVVYQPNYAPGNTGFNVKWLNADPNPDIANKPAYIKSLYRTVQFQVESIEGATAPTGGYNWSMPNGANSEPGTESGKDNWIFRQTIPAYKVAKINPYESIGKKVDLNIRILDMYGNALPNNLIKTLSTTIVYNDPLMAFSQLQWFKVAYSVGSGSGEPVLDIDMAFDSTTVQSLLAAGGNAQQQIDKALAQYNTAIAQISDPNTSLQINTSLAANSFTVDKDSKALKTSMLNYLKTVAAYLTNTSTTAPEPLVIGLPLKKSFVNGMPNDLFIINVDVAISRAADKLDSSITDLLPRVGSVTNILLPFVTPQPASGEADSDLTNTPSLAAFADQFEAAYEGFDGADGQLKIGKGADFSSGLKNAKKSAIWGIKWSKEAGMEVSVPFTTAPDLANHPIYYAPAPLSTQLISRTEDVIQYIEPTWDGTSADIKNGDLPINFANIDMDAWALQFLTAFHDFVSPEMAAAIAKLDGTTYDNLMEYKNQIAEAISNTIDEIITPDTGQLSGDLASAQERMLQSLLNSLTNDYATSALVQVPSTVIVKGAVESGVDPNYPPTLFGKVSANLAPTDKETPYTVSNAYLPLVDGDQHLNFLISAKHPDQQPDLNLDLFYDIGFINHQFEVNEEVNGFVPSSWITVILPARKTTSGALPPLQVPMNNLDIPIPLRAFPSPPSFSKQSAVGNPNSTDIKELVLWDYNVGVNRPKAAQDELLLEISFNENVDGDAMAPQGSRQVMLADTQRAAPKDLFEALARFTYEYPEILPHLDTIPDAAFQNQNVPVAQAALSRFTELVQGIAGQWKNWNNPAVDYHTTRLGAFTGGTSAPGITPIDQKYKFEFSDEGNTITVTGMSYTSSDNPALADLPYPDITGYTKGAMSNNVVVYTLSGGAAPENIQLSFTALNIGTHQSAISRAYIERNADIAPTGYTTNPKFVFRTAIVSFKNPIVPLIEANQPITLPAASNLSAVIKDYFENYLGTDGQSTVVKELQFTLEAGAEFLMSADDTNPTDHTLVSQTPILLSQKEVSTPSNTSGQPATTLADYEKKLTEQLVNWHKGASTASPTQMLYLSFVLFADVSDSKLPLLRIRELLITPSTDNDWWT